MKRTKLVIDYEYDFNLIGIISTAKGYKLAWELNQALGIHLVKQSEKEQATQLLIEAPYRNRHTLDALLQTLPEHALLSVAWNLTLPTQGAMTHSIFQWKKMLIAQS